MKNLLAVAFILAAVAVSGCAQAQIHTINIEDPGLLANHRFNPDTVTIRVGDNVRWINSDDTPHTVTSDSGTELQSSSIPTGSEYSHTFLRSGTYTYHCAIHPEMTGTVIVQ